MNFGHSCETWREILAYPYPGRSVKTSSGRAFPGQRTSKKLMLRVRPGVELLLATLLPSRELMTLDLPTLERPRNAISGRSGAGHWRASVTAIVNRARTPMDLVWRLSNRVASRGVPYRVARVRCPLARPRSRPGR